MVCSYLVLVECINCLFTLMLELLLMTSVTTYGVECKKLHGYDECTANVR